MADKIIDYKTLSVMDSTTKLDKLVRQHLGDGWQLQGGGFIAAWSSEDSGGTEYCQTIIRIATE